MTLHSFLTVLRRRVRLLVAIFVLAVCGGLVLSLTTTPTYDAKATLYFSVRTATGVDDLSNGASFTRAQMASFATLAVTPKVLAPVADRLDYPGGATALAEHVSASAANDTVLMTITVTDTDPRRATAAANAIARQTITIVEDVSPADPAGGGAALKVSVVTPASVPRSASAPNTMLNLAAAAVLGLALGVLFVLAREALDTRVRGVEDVARLASRPVIGSIGTASPRQGRVTVETDPHSPQSEAYRQLRTNLQFLDVGARDDEGRTRRAPRVLAVTSSIAGEGKSTVAVNLAVALAETSARVLLVDADLRRPTVATTLGIEGAAGLTTVLLGEAGVDELVQRWGRSDLHVLASGTLPPNPSELLGSPAMRRFLDDARSTYDYVVVDSAPLLPVADGAILSGVVEGTIVVANETKVRRHQLAESLRTLTGVEARVLGVVLNQVSRSTRGYGYYQADPSKSAPPAASRDGATDVPVPVGR